MGEMSKFGAPEDGDDENDGSGEEEEEEEENEDDENDGSGDSEDEDDEDDGSGDSEDEEDEESEDEEEEEEEEVCEDPKNFLLNGKKRNCRRFLTKQFNKKGKKKACKKFGKFCPKRCKQCESIINNQEVYCCLQRRRVLPVETSSVVLPLLL